MENSFMESLQSPNVKMNRKMQKSLSLQKKLEILSAVDDAKLKKTEIAIKFGIAKSTVSTILKNREKIEGACAFNVFEPARKRMRIAKNEEVEIALMRWIREIRAQNLTFTGAIIQEKARFFAEALNVTNFQCSSGWLQRFKDRHGIVCKKATGEKASLNADTINVFLKDKFPTILKTYAASDVYSVDETALFWRALPTRSLSLKCSGGKCSKERLTTLVACNMDGTEKLPLLVIGESEKPRCFKTLKTLPVKYDCTKKAWMTSEIFFKWVKQLDQKFQEQGRRICLLLDKCSAHCPVSELKAIQLEFLPPDTTSRTQPCGQGIIRSLKTYYRRELIRQAIYCFHQKIEFKINLLDALTLLRAAWREVTSKTIINSFSKAGFVRSNITEDLTMDEQIEFDMTDAQACGVLPNSVTFDTYVSMDDNVMTCDVTTDTKIVDGVYGMTKPLSDNDDYFSDTDEDVEDCSTANECPVSVMKAFTALQTVRRFVMQEADSETALENVDKLNDFWQHRADRKQNQPAHTDFL